METMNTTVSALMQQGRGILAADESNKTADKRFAAVGVAETEENRRRYRELLFTAPGVHRYLSGVILYDETIRQSTTDGTPFPQFLIAHDVHAGIKVDQGLEDMPGQPGAQVTEGLDGLSERLQEYKTLGATFAKWRAVAHVGDGYADQAIKENAKRLAQYAVACHALDLVPMVEPEVLMEGMHSAEDAEGTLIETLAIVADALQQAGVSVPQVIFKTSMAVSGKEAPSRAAPSEVAERTVRALKTALPETAGGVVFLSGGQTPQEATANFNAIARLEPHPWPITFSFSRALQEPVLKLWAGNDAMREEAQSEFLKRLTLNVAADAGGYSPGMESV